MLRLVRKLGVDRVVVWRWGTERLAATKNDAVPPVVPRRMLEGDMVKAPDPNPSASMVRDGPCHGVPSGEHEAMLAVPESVTSEMTTAWRKDARCRYCGSEVPAKLGFGSITYRERWSTGDRLQPGDCYWLPVRADMVTSRQAMGYDALAVDRHLVVVLPDGAKWDMYAPLGFDTQEGWTIRGLFPRLSTVPDVDTSTWYGRLLDGEFVESKR